MQWSSSGEMPCHKLSASTSTTTVAAERSRITAGVSFPHCRNCGSSMKDPSLTWKGLVQKHGPVEEEGRTVAEMRKKRRSATITRINKMKSVRVFKTFATCSTLLYRDAVGQILSRIRIKMQKQKS